MSRFADRVHETSTTTGTGTLSLSGASTGFQSFVDGIGSGNTVAYVITDGVEWETGIGTVTSGTPDTLSRDTVNASSNSDNKVSFTNNNSASRDVFCAPIAITLAVDEGGTGAATAAAARTNLGLAGAPAAISLAKFHHGGL